MEKSVWKAIPRRRFNYRESIKRLGTILFEENEIAALRKNQPSTRIPDGIGEETRLFAFESVGLITLGYQSCRARLPIRSNVIETR